MTSNRLLVPALLLLSALCSAQTRTVSLDDCLESAAQNNPYVKNAALDINSAKMQKQEALTKYFPTVSAHAYAFASLNPLVDVSLEDFLGGSDAAHNLSYYLGTAADLSGANTEWQMLKQGYVIGASLVQPVFAGGRIVNGNALARLGIEAAELKRDIAVRDNRKEITAKYWTVVSLEEKKKALAKAIEMVEGIRKDVESARAAGLAVDADLLQVRVKAAELDAAARKLNSGERLAKMDLFNACGIEYKTLELDSMGLQGSFDELKAPQTYYRDETEAAAGTTESELLALNVKSKELTKKMAVGETLPEIGIGAAYGYSDLDLVTEPRMNGAVLATVKIPLTDWGAASRKIRRCNNEIQKAQNEKEYLDGQLVLKARKAWMELESAWDQVGIARETVGLSEMRLSHVRASYSAGMATLSEVLQAQTELQSGETALADARIAYCNALLDWTEL